MTGRWQARAMLGEARCCRGEISERFVPRRTGRSSRSTCGGWLDEGRVLWDSSSRRHRRGRTALAWARAGLFWISRVDLTGQVLKDSMVKAARAAELTFFHRKNVWMKVPRSEAQAQAGRRPISVRLVDVNDGDDVNPNYRSRLVTRQPKARDTSGQSYFVPRRRWRH